jgi:hypothetical protein
MQWRHRAVAARITSVRFDRRKALGIQIQKQLLLFGDNARYERGGS